jgi:hypothetical protein
LFSIAFYSFIFYFKFISCLSLFVFDITADYFYFFSGCPVSGKSLFADESTSVTLSVPMAAKVSLLAVPRSALQGAISVAGGLSAAVPLRCAAIYNGRAPIFYIKA